MEELTEGQKIIIDSIKDYLKKDKHLLVGVVDIYSTDEFMNDLEVYMKKSVDSWIEKGLSELEVINMLSQYGVPIIRRNYD